MVNHCTNPDCRVEFDVLSSGDLYAYERRSVDTEFFWLCSECAARHDLYLGAAGCISLRARGAVHHGSPPQPGSKLRLVTRSKRSSPRLQTVPSGDQAHRFVEGVNGLRPSR
jgi:hypothetical protein